MNAVTKFLLIVILVLLLIVALLTFLPRGAHAESPQALTLSVLPGTVNRYDNYGVLIVGPANASFILKVYGPNSFYFQIVNRTTTAGNWAAGFAASYDFGSYYFQVFMGNQSASSSLTVGCDARCTQGILEDNGRATQQGLYAYAVQFGTYALLIVLAFEIPRQVAYFSRQAKDAKEHGRYTVKESLWAPFARLRGHINPGDQVADPANVQNPRIAVDLERRRLIEQMHDVAGQLYEATGKAYMEWSPKHIGVLDELVVGVKSAYRRQADLQPEPMPYAKTYEIKVTPTPIPRPRSQADPPDVVAISTSQLNREKRTMMAVAEFAEDGTAKAGLNTDGAQRRVRARRRWHVAIAAAVIVGVPATLEIVLGDLAYAQVYVEPFRSAWQPWMGAWGPWPIVMAGVALIAVIANLTNAGAKLKGTARNGRA